ncbi:hypothetical protein ABZ815_45080 [Nonomuraea sp. NPDC047529]|uniref:hypothetical protein n=1 Tax=Nonomuraea sp. NPDC047529 TaxID=3155623 RepID=UPI00340D3B7C
MDMLRSLAGTPLRQASFAVVHYPHGWACAFRGLLGPDRPIDRAAYAFMDPASAKEHPHELWLREPSERVHEA